MIRSNMPTNPATLPVTARRAPTTNATPNAAAVAARSAGLSLSGLSTPNPRQTTDTAFPNLLADALQAADPSTSRALFAGVGAESLAGAGLSSPANFSGGSAIPGLGNANPLAGLVNSGPSALGGALSGLGSLASLFGVGAVTAPLAPAQKQAGEKAVETALGYLGRYDWNNYCERFVEVCYGTKNLYPNAATAGRALASHKGMSSLAQAPVGAILYFGANAGNQQQGHAGLYLGDGRMVSATPNGVKMERVDSPAYAGLYIGWAEPGSFGRGRVGVPAGASAVGSDPRTIGASRSQSVSQLGSAIPPTLPRVGGTTTSSAATVRPATSIGAGAPKSTTSAPVARRAVTPSPSTATNVATVGGSAGALPALPATAPEAFGARPIVGASSVAPPLPLTARAIAGMRAPLGFGATNPLSPLAATNGVSLNRRA
jgi:hypothetical protein